MKASETKLARLIEGTNQYLVPHFQRPYTWQQKHWNALWDNIVDLVEISAGETASEHFLGAIVTAPAHSVPEGVTKYLLIDGQQRLTTLLTLLAAVRDRATSFGDDKLANKIHELYLTNRYQDGLDHYKLLPTQGGGSGENDRDAFKAIVDRQAHAARGGLAAAYEYFSNRLGEHNAETLSNLVTALMARLLLVSIVLERDDNPYAIFESLNATGQTLEQSDLLRNFFFMSIDSSRHDTIYHDKWVPMEKAVSREHMEDFIRHYLMRDGTVVKKADVYFTLKKRLERQGRDNAETVLDNLLHASEQYARFVDPTRESSSDVRERLLRLNRIESTVCYPFLLHIFHERAVGSLSDVDTIEILDIVENFLVRRYVCGVIRAELNKLFPTLYAVARTHSSVASGVREVLGTRNYPGDIDFMHALQTRNLYGQGERRQRAHLILERLERAMSPKEHVDVTRLEIEHVMPQTLTPWWQAHLGESAQDVHGELLHTIGNLTLTGYNQEMSNLDFAVKREQLRKSNLSLNRIIAASERWGRVEIEERARALAAKAIEVWPNLAPAGRRERVTGTTPSKLIILEHGHPVRSWQDVWRITLEEVSKLGQDVFSRIASDLSRYVSAKNAGMRVPRQLPNGAFYESHLNAEQIRKLSLIAAQAAGLSASDWRVELNDELTEHAQHAPGRDQGSVDDN